MWFGVVIQNLTVCLILCSFSFNQWQKRSKSIVWASYKRSLWITSLLIHIPNILVSILILLQFAKFLLHLAMIVYTHLSNMIQYSSLVIISFFSVNWFGTQSSDFYMYPAFSEAWENYWSRMYHLLFTLAKYCEWILFSIHSNGIQTEIVAQML